MIKIFSRIGDSKNPDGTDIPKILITAGDRYGGGHTFAGALRHIMTKEGGLNSDLKDIIFGKFVSLHAIEDDNTIALYDWARIQFPEEFI